MRYRWTVGILAVVVIIAGTGNLLACRQECSGPAAYIRSHYTKFEYRVPMRDGVRLFTAVYIPSDTSQDYPLLMLRTPYSVKPYGADRFPDSLGPHEEFAREGYIFVYQDVRGRFMSEGQFLNMRPHIDNKQGARGPDNNIDTDESTDTYDTIEWLLEHVPTHNGRVGQWGNSYPGFYCSAGMIDSHPALKAVMPSAPIADWFWDDMHHHGAFVLSLSFNFFSRFGVARTELTTEHAPRFDHGTPDGYQFFLDLGPLKNVNRQYFGGEIEFWNLISQHPNYDEFWQSRNILPHLSRISAAVMTVGGWFDAEDLYGPLNTYRSIEEKNPGISNVLVMGPWRHGDWLRSDGRRLGPADFGFATSETFRQQALVPFFRHHLKQEGEVDLPEAWMFETRANRWRRVDHWPPQDLERQTLYFHPAGGLTFDAPDSGDSEGFDEYISDPARPVPYTPAITTRWHSEYMVEDQRFAAWRPDVLVYRTAPLEGDLTLAGPLTARLWVATTGTSADWVVKLIDEYPPRLPGFEPNLGGSDEDGEEDLGGTQRMVRSEVFRGRFRNSYEEPEPFVAGEVTALEFKLLDVLHTFKRDHRIMVQIQSSLFPFIDRNPQTYVPNIFDADADDFIKATHRVYRSAEHPSGLEVGVLKGPGS